MAKQRRFHTNQPHQDPGATSDPRHSGPRPPLGDESPPQCTTPGAHLAPLSRRAFIVGLLGSALAAIGCTPPITVTVGQPNEPGHPHTNENLHWQLPTPADGSPNASGPQTSGRSSVMTGAIPVGMGVLRSAPATALHIPAVGLSTEVVEVASIIDGDDWIWPIPPDVAGHHLGSANPGEPGNIVISGHVDTHAGPNVFAPLLRVEPGHEVTLESSLGAFNYRVQSVSIVPHTDIGVLLQVPYEILTLITCVPVGAYLDRLVVQARPLHGPTAYAR